MSIPEKHHYVWRRYLNPWSTDEKRVYTLLRKQNKILLLAKMDVAQERGFYRLIDLTEEEEEFIRKFIYAQCPPVLVGLNLDFLALYTVTRKLKDSLAASTRQFDREEYRKKIRDHEMSLMEYGHGRIEGLGHRLINTSNLNDLKSIIADDYHFDAIMYLYFQYFRTRNMRNNALASFRGKPMEKFAEKSWNIFSHILATILARNVSMDDHLKFLYIINNTSCPFITGDQPVVNLRGKQRTANGDVEGLELYYPISPRSAILIHFRPSQHDQFDSVEVTEQDAERYNFEIFEESHYFVFANNEAQLHHFLNM